MDELRRLLWIVSGVMIVGGVVMFTLNDPSSDGAVQYIKISLYGLFIILGLQLSGLLAELWRYIVTTGSSVFAVIFKGKATNTPSVPSSIPLEKTDEDDRFLPSKHDPHRSRVVNPDNNDIFPV